MHDCDDVFTEKFAEEFKISDISYDESASHRASKSGREVVQGDHVVAALRQVSCTMRTDVAGPSSD